MRPFQLPPDTKRLAYLAGAVLCGIGSVLFLVISMPVIGMGLGRAGPFPILMPLLTIGAIVGAVMCAKRAIALGMAVVTAKSVTPNETPLGGQVQVALRLLPREQFQISRFDFVLEMEEHAISRGGTSDTHYRHRTRLETRTVPGLETRPGIETEVVQIFSVPANAPPSFHGRNNFITWRVKVHCAVPGWRPDLHEQIEFDVLAEVLPEAAHG